MSRTVDRVLLSLGSNVGDLEANLDAAVSALETFDRTRLCRVSHLYETEAWGVPDQPRFLNLAAEIETALTPLELLDAVKETEARMGRKAGPRWGPRVIDIDIILWEGRTIDAPGLKVPHKAFRQRAFVLAPLQEIAGDWVDPETGLTVAELAARPDAKGRVKIVPRAV